MCSCIRRSHGLSTTGAPYFPKGHTLKVTRAEMPSDGPTPDEEAATARHFEYLKRLNEKGTALLAGRTQKTDEGSFGIVIFDVDFDDAARAI